MHDLAPLAPDDPSGTIEFYGIAFLTIGAGVGGTVMGRILGTVARPTQLLERTITLPAYTSLLAAILTWLADGALHALAGHPGELFLVLWAYTLAVGGAVTGIAAAFGTAASLVLIIFLVIVGNPSSGGPVSTALLPAFFSTLSPTSPRAEACGYRATCSTSGHTTWPAERHACSPGEPAASCWPASPCSTVRSPAAAPPGAHHERPERGALMIM